MNKQELTEKLDENIRNYKERAKDKYVLPSSKNILMSRVYGLAQAQTLVEELEETPLVTVPLSIDEHMKTCKFAGDNMYESILSTSSEIYEWYVANSEIYEQAWTNGYEVEKEPLYEVQLPGTAWGTFLVKADDGDLLVWQNSMKGTPFTESEIKSIDERYWAFAVPVEEDK